MGPLPFQGSFGHFGGKFALAPVLFFFTEPDPIATPQANPELKSNLISFLISSELSYTGINVVGASVGS